MSLLEDKAVETPPRAVSHGGVVDVGTGEPTSLVGHASPLEASEKQDIAEADVSPRNIHGWKWGLVIMA